MLSVKPQDNWLWGNAAFTYATADKAPAQTDAKARLIANYISKFQLVTGGGLYIDGFAAPQKHEFRDAWTARRVLELEPKRLRRFWLCDLDPEGVAALRDLKSKHHREPRFRHVHVLEGDFNTTFKTILKSGRIKRRSAVFALLDQRSTECAWSTVAGLAEYKGVTRIELLYFLGTGWLHRSLNSAKRPETVKQIRQWWGGDDWKKLTGKSQTQLSTVVAQRFQKELGYKYATIWPVFLKEGSGKVAFSLIHATDHDAAPKLMFRAYRDIYGDRPGSPTDPQPDLPLELT